MDIETIKRIAGLARIELADGEAETFKEDIDNILDLIGILGEAPECDSFCFDPVGIYGELRDDVPIIDSTAEEMLAAMNTYEGFVRGPKIV